VHRINSPSSLRRIYFPKLLSSNLAGPTMNSLNRLLVSALGLSFIALSSASFAAQACYTPAQLQAEQLLRLHSELMVITVTCKQGAQGESLGPEYGDFTHKNIRVLHDAEQTMIGYYESHSKGNAIEHLDHLRTTLANEIGQKVANMSAPEFCGEYREKVAKFDAASPADVENEVERMKLADHSYVRACDEKKGS
jgi:hypothetical protein